MATDHEMALSTLANMTDEVREICFDPMPYLDELSPVLWRNAQWAVTEYGIENVCGRYHYYIGKSQLSPSWRWIEHVGAKTWVDPELFAEAYAKAIEIHGAKP